MSHIKYFGQQTSKVMITLETTSKSEYINILLKAVKSEEVDRIHMTQNGGRVSGFYEPGSELWCCGSSGFSSPASDCQLLRKNFSPWSSLLCVNFTSPQFNFFLTTDDSVICYSLLSAERDVRPVGHTDTSICYLMTMGWGGGEGKKGQFSRNGMSHIMISIAT
jgi:hypothetical protein